MALKINPSMQSKKRYLLLTGATKEEISRAIMDGIGALGWAKASPAWVDSGSQAILAVERDSLEEVKASLALAPQNIILKKVSGTLKGFSK